MFLFFFHSTFKEIKLFDQICVCYNNNCVFANQFVGGKSQRYLKGAFSNQCKHKHPKGLSLTMDGCRVCMHPTTIDSIQSFFQSLTHKGSYLGNYKCVCVCVCSSSVLTMHNNRGYRFTIHPFTIYLER